MARVIVGLTMAVALSACSNSNQSQNVAGASPPARIETAPLPSPQQPVHQVAYAPTLSAPALPARGPEAPVPKVKGVYKVGKPYVINGVTYYPQEDPGYDRVGIASWYGTDFHSKQTANGERFDMNAVTAAHPTLPIPSYVYATNLSNGRTLLVRVNDRGPYKPGRIIDLSRQSARLLGFEGNGITQIRVRYAGPAPLDPVDDRRERQYLAAQPWSRSLGVTAMGRPRGWFGLGGPR
jgi:rare lipoprotein A